jgi:hypothetical protein
MKRLARKAVRKISYFSCGIFLLFSCNQNNGNGNVSSNAITNLTQFVDPYIGTGFHGHVFMGANVPFGCSTIGAGKYVGRLGLVFGLSLF